MEREESMSVKDWLVVVQFIAPELYQGLINYLSKFDIRLDNKYKETVEFFQYTYSSCKSSNVFSVFTIKNSHNMHTSKVPNGKLVFLSVGLERILVHSDTWANLQKKKTEFIRMGYDKNKLKLKYI